MRSLTNHDVARLVSDRKGCPVRLMWRLSEQIAAQPNEEQTSTPASKAANFHPFLPGQLFGSYDIHPLEAAPSGMCTFPRKHHKKLTGDGDFVMLRSQDDSFREKITKRAIMAKKTQASVIEQLFHDFYHAAQGTFRALEVHYLVNGVCEQIFGVDSDEEAGKANLRKSYAWATLVALYEYAVNGVEPGEGFEGSDDLVIDASDVIELASSENYMPSAKWDTLIAMGDGRFALDSGNPILPYKLSLLANVDIRTVRNAISAGELVAFKSEFDGEVYVENGSARRWLHGRRGFKPTLKEEDSAGVSIDSVSTPAEFGAMLASRRKNIGLNEQEAKPSVAHPSVTPLALSELEAGVFALPLDAIFPLADYYLLDRKKLLQCVMRVFFKEEMHLLLDVTEA